MFITWRHATAEPSLCCFKINQDMFGTDESDGYQYLAWSLLYDPGWENLSRGVGEQQVACDMQRKEQILGGIETE